jgi:glycerol-3-phosphate dehydrogenase
VLRQRLGAGSASGVRLVKGSHIVVPRVAEGEQAYILQQPDGRVVFVLPYGDFSLVGTTDVPVEAPEEAVIGEEEVRYLCAAANRYFLKQTEAADIVWSYSGVRSLYDDGAASAQAVTRDYRLELDGGPGAKLLSVFGGKITTARALAEEALDKMGIGGPKATATAALPGGDLGPAFDAYLAELARWMPPPLLGRLSRAYGTKLRDLIDGAAQLDDLGRDLGAGLHEAELRYMREHEFARSAEDILWRRTKLGLRMSREQREKVELALR